MNWFKSASLLAVLVVAQPGFAGGNTECDVRIELSSSTFKSSYAARPTLHAENGTSVIYIPFGVQRTLQAVNMEDVPVLPPPISYDVKASSLSSLDSVSYQLGSNDLLGIDWEDVGVPSSQSSFKVLPGRYRFKLVYAVVAPREQRGPMVHLCRVYSQAFTLLTEDGWTEFR